MELYTSLRAFADSWALLVLVTIFIAIVLYTCRRSSRRLHEDCADIPFRHDDGPAQSPRDCGGGR